jgi:hypothetical protein
MLALSRDWLQKSLEVLTPAAYTNKAFNLSDQDKSVLLLQATKSEQAYKLDELPDSLVWEDRKRLKKQSQLQAKLVEKYSKEEKGSLRNELNRVNQDIDSFSKMIEKVYPKYHKPKYQNNDANVEDIQALLDDKTVLLQYVISDSLLHIFKVSKNEVQWLPQPIQKKALQDNIKALHSVLKDYRLLAKKADKSYQKYTELAYWFYQNCIEPVMAADKGITDGSLRVQHLIIVTDGRAWTLAL